MVHDAFFVFNTFSNAVIYWQEAVNHLLEQKIRRIIQLNGFLISFIFKNMERGISKVNKRNHSLILSEKDNSNLLCTFDFQNCSTSNAIEKLTRVLPYLHEMLNDGEYAEFFTGWKKRWLWGFYPKTFYSRISNC